MKMVRVLFVIGLFAVLSGPALAQCPVEGIYKTTNGTISAGRVSEVWCTGDGPGTPGNTENAMSWSGAGLGAQWHVWGMAIDENGPGIVGSNLDAYGNGYIDYETSYDGGEFWLSKDHLWSDGVNDLTGAVTMYNVATRVSLIGGEIVGAISNVYLTGLFDNCPNCELEYVISNVMLSWMTGWGGMPSDYPSFLCGAVSGELFDVCCIQASINCGIGSEPTSWGAIKNIMR